jgi:hypothetical protein
MHAATETERPRGESTDVLAAVVDCERSVYVDPRPIVRRRAEGVPSRRVMNEPLHVALNVSGGRASHAETKAMAEGTRSKPRPTIARVGRATVLNAT